MQITIIKKNFLLAGYETAMDFERGFGEEMQWIQSELRRSVDRIANKIKPQRIIGFWQPWQAFASEPDPRCASKAKYFLGVEVAGLHGIPSDCVVKVIGESCYAVYREERRGTAPKAQMYGVEGYCPNYEVAGDFEIFDDFDHLGETDACDVLVPVKLK